MMDTTTMTWAIAGMTALGVITRPFSLPEAVWAVLGAVLLLALGLIGLPEAWTGVVKGLDVYPCRISSWMLPMF